MICMCEVGEAARALSSQEMKEVADQSVLSWQEAAREHFQLQHVRGRSTENDDLPTGPNPVLRPSHPQQPLLCTRAATHSADAPVHWSRWCDCRHHQCPRAIRQTEAHGRSTHTTLLRNLLQSNSSSIPGAAIGGARFLIGRDMNTGSFRMSQLLQDHRELAPRTEQPMARGSLH